MASAATASPTPKGAKEFSRYKLVFVGDVEVGKTSVIGRYVHGDFNDSYQNTIGIDFLSKALRLEGRTIRLQLWDTAGQERFRSLIPSYIRDSSAVMVVYDITNRTSFASCSEWIQHVREQQGEGGHLVLVGNKVDLAANRQVTPEEGEAVAREMGTLFFEVSAKSGHNINELFDKLVATLPVPPTGAGQPLQHGGSRGGELASERGDHYHAPERGGHIHNNNKVELGRPPEGDKAGCSC